VNIRRSGWGAPRFEIQTRVRPLTQTDTPYLTGRAMPVILANQDCRKSQTGTPGLARQGPCWAEDWLLMDEPMPSQMGRMRERLLAERPEAVFYQRGSKAAASSCWKRARVACALWLWDLTKGRVCPPMGARSR